MLLTEKLVKFRRQNKPSPSDLNNKEKQELVSKLREYFEKREGDERLEDSSSEGTCQIDGLSFPQPSFGYFSFSLVFGRKLVFQITKFTAASHSPVEK